MVGPEIEYVKVKDQDSGKYYILAPQSRLRLFKEAIMRSSRRIHRERACTACAMSRSFLILPTRKDGAFRVILEDSVVEEDGTGHCPCGAGVWRSRLFCLRKREGIELVCPVDQNGKFTSEVPDYEGLFVKDADKEIIRGLKQKRRSSTMDRSATATLSAGAPIRR